MGYIEQIKNYALALIDRAFGWQKEENEWKAALVDENVPFHYHPIDEATEIAKAYTGDESVVKPTRGRKPKSTETVEAPKKTRAVQEPIKTKRKVHSPAKVGTVTPAKARKAVKAVMDKKETGKKKK